MNTNKLLLSCLIGFSMNSIAKDAISDVLPNVEISAEQAIEQDNVNNADFKLDVNLIQDLQIPEKTKKIYLDHAYDAQEYPIIERFLFCLQSKWEDIGHDACDTPGSIKELHYIIAGEALEELANLSKQQVGEEFYTFYDIFMNIHSYPLTDYEREQVVQNAERRYLQELVKEMLWKKIKANTQKASNLTESKRDSIKLALTIERNDEMPVDHWKQLEQVVCQCCKECEQVEENSPTFLQDAKEHIGKIIMAIEELPSFYGLFELDTNSSDAQE